MKKITNLLLTLGVQDTYIKHAQETPELEVCGILKGYYTTDGDVLSRDYHRIKNVSETPSFHYILNPDEWLKFLMDSKLVAGDGSYDLPIIYHTHPATPPVPSHVDTEEAEWSTIYLIYSPKYNESKAWFWSGDYWDEINIITRC